MKDIHLSAYGNPAQSLSMLEVPEPNAISANEALVRMEYAPIEAQRPPFSERSGKNGGRMSSFLGSSAMRSASTFPPPSGSLF